MATARSIVTDALVEIGFLRFGETPKADAAQLALRYFQKQIDAWAADRLTLSVLLRTTFTLASGDSSVTLGSSGADVTMVRPVYLSAVNYIIPASDPEVEVPIGIMDDDSYASLTIKELQSSLPLQCFYNTSISTILGTLFFWPQVTQDVDIVLYTAQAVGVPTSLDSVLLCPPGYSEGFHYQLAKRLCNPFGIALTPELNQMATEAFANMKRPNVYPGMLGVDAALVPMIGGGYNILSDTTTSSR